jgi:hypothetical protein
MRTLLVKPLPFQSLGNGAVTMAFRKNVIEDVKYFDDRLDVGAAGCSGDSRFGIGCWPKHDHSL